MTDSNKCESIVFFFRKGFISQIESYVSQTLIPNPNPNLNTNLNPERGIYGTLA